MRLGSVRTPAIATALVTLLATLALVAVAPAASAATLTGVAFKDLDRDGAWQTSEPVLADQEIHLYNTAGSNIALTRTDVFGRYTFANLADATYRVAFDAPSWWALRDNWVPTTTGSLLPSRSVTVSATTTADFGWRPIVRSTDPAAPISTYTGPSGLRVSSYDDVVGARELHDTLAGGARIGAEAPFTEIRFDLYAGSLTSSSAFQSGGRYVNYHAVSD